MSHVTCQLLQLQHIQTFVWLVCGYFPFFKPLLQWKFAYRNGLLLLWLSSMNEAGTFCHNHRRHLDKWHARLLRVALSNSIWGLGFVKFWYFGTCFTFFFWVLGCSLLVVSSTNSLGNTPCISTKKNIMDIPLVMEKCDFEGKRWTSQNSNLALPNTDLILLQPSCYRI